MARSRAELNAVIGDAMAQFAEASRENGMSPAQFEAEAMAVLCKMQAVLLSGHVPDERARILAQMAVVVCAEADVVNSRIAAAKGMLQ